jgi:hypothetical protein
MGKHSAVSEGQKRLAGGLLLGAVTTGALAIGSMSTAGSANATCISFSGMNNGQGCTTTNAGDLAIAIGPRAGARASGGFNVSIAVGSTALATGDGVGNVALAFGNQAHANMQGNFNTGLAVGNPGPNVRWGPNWDTTVWAAGTLNRAFAFGNGANAEVEGGQFTEPTPGFPREKGVGLNTSIAIGHGSFSSAGGDGTKATTVAALGNKKYARHGINKP